MSLPWVRLESNIASHDKILALLAERDGAKAFVLYICALGYSGGHGTDGVIPRYVLPVVHGTEKLAQLLVDKGLWEYTPDAEYLIHNFDMRQELAVISEGKRASKSLAGKKGMCKRYHGPNCNCWRNTGTVSYL